MGWQDLSEREKELDRRIESCGIRLDGSKSCLSNVLRRIGATQNEESFVQYRINLRLRTQELLRDTDNKISDTEAMLERFKKEDEEWERKGRELGFKF